MEPLSSQSSPTLRSPLLPLRQNFPHANLDLANTILSGTMNNAEDDEAQGRTASAPMRTPKSDKSHFFFYAHQPRAQAMSTLNI